MCTTKERLCETTRSLKTRANTRWRPTGWVGVAVLLVAAPGIAQTTPSGTSLAACQGPATAETLSDMLTSVRTIELDEPDDSPIVQVTGLSASRSGWVLIADRREHNVKIFDRDGRSLGMVGRRGSGPGEFRQVKGATWLQDSLIATVDDGLKRVQVFSVQGELVSSFNVDVGPVGGIAAGTEGLVIAGLGPVSQLSGDALRLIQLVDPLSGTQRSVVPFPQVAGALSAIFGAPPLISTVGGPTRFVVTWRFADEVLLIDEGGTVLRRGELADDTGLFRSAVEAIQSGVAWADLVREASPIVTLAATSTAVVVGYVSSDESRRGRFFLLDTDLNVIRSDLKGPFIKSASGDSLVSVRSEISDTDETVRYFISWHTWCDTTTTGQTR